MKVAALLFPSIANVALSLKKKKNRLFGQVNLLGVRSNREYSSLPEKA